MTTELTATFEEFKGRIEVFSAAVLRSDLDTSVWLTRVYVTLADVHAGAIRLPEVSPSAGEHPADVVDLAEWTPFPIAEAHERLGGAATYWAVYDAKRKARPIPRDLVDDLSEIYDDLQAGIAVGNLAVRMSDALWLWRETFWTHWGHHAVSVLVALHELLGIEGPFEIDDLFAGGVSRNHL